MKKVKFILLTFIIIFCLSIINVDAEEVTIKSINLVDYTGSTTELSTPTISGLKINFDLSFINVNDMAKYEVILNNPTSTEYEINMDNTFNNSEYMEYNYEFKDKSNRVKPNSDVTLYIVIKYKKAVPSEQLVDGKYIENNTLDISLLNENNPDTISVIAFIILILLIIAGFTVLVIKLRKHKTAIPVIIALLLIPVTVFAVEKLVLTVSTKITIEEAPYNIYYEFVNGNFSAKAGDLDDNYCVNNRCYEGCTEAKYEQEDGSYDDYYLCENLLIKNSRSYAVGDRVNLDPVSFDYFNYSKCSYNPDEHNFICEKNSITSEIVNNVYYKQGIENNKELDTMNFESIEYNNWNNEGFIMLDLPNKFTMPEFNVNFWNNYGK